MIIKRFAVAQTVSGWISTIPQGRFKTAWPLFGILLTPVAVAAGALAAWRLGTDAGWTGTFFIANGFLSHWQVWCAFAITAQACAYSLGRGAGAREEPSIPALARVRSTSS